MAGGIDTVVNDGTDLRPLIRWLRDGAALEDEPGCRARSHFHNPLRPFTDSGVTDLWPPVRLACARTPFSLTFSSPVWGTRYTSPSEKGTGTGNTFDWDTARSAYADALTLAAPVERETSLARTFETLGHVMHLVQDLAVPAHVRNDFQSHLQYLHPSTEFARWTQNGFERFVRLNPELVDQAAEEPGDVPFQGLPVTRFWDLDSYTGDEPSKDTGNAWGLAEYTNANFASQYTILTESFPSWSSKFFPYPRESGTNLQDVVTQTLATRTFIAEDSKVDVGLYIAKTTDGETIEHFARLGYLWSDIAPASLRNSLQLDDVVNADYAARLLPKALFYSRGVLDYFFRGKLELTFDVDPGDSTKSRLVAVNRSEDSIGDGGTSTGTLTVYTDSQGERRGLASVTTTGSYAKGTALPALTGLDPLLEVSELTAVYRGPLGAERDAVIGKVQGAAEVEHIFRGTSDWMLRTADGVYSLGLGTGPARVKWGDRDNTLVTETYLTGDDRIYVAYEINRPEGTRAVPLKDGVVDLSALGAPVRLGSAPIELGTTVALTREVQYAQELVTIDGYYVYQYDEATGTGTLIDRRFGPSSSAVVYENVYGFTAEFPLVLTAPTPSGLDYWWRLVDIGLDRSGHVIGLIRVGLSGRGSIRVPVWRHRHGEGSVPEPAIESRSPYVYLNAPPGATFVFVVDLTRRAVIGQSAEPRVALTYRTAQRESFMDLHVIPVDAPWPPGYVALSVGGTLEGEPEVGHKQQEYGPTQLIASDLYTPELRALGFRELDAPVPQTTEAVVPLADPFWLWGSKKLPAAVRITTTQWQHPGGGMEPYEMRRSNGPEEGYAILAWGGDATTVTWTPVWWFPTRPEARAFATLTTPWPSTAWVPDANRGTTMVNTRLIYPLPYERKTYLITAQSPPLTFDTDLSGTYELLEPNLLFSRTDLHFHRLVSGVPALEAPRALKSGPTTGEYHTVGRL